MNVFNKCSLIQLKKNMLRKEMNRLLSKDMWMFLIDALKCNYRNK